jgi:predicted ATPase
MQIGDGTWRYRLEFHQDRTHAPIVRKEEVWCGDEKLLTRPDRLDCDDPQRLTQTHLEQVNANKGFRQVAEFLAQVSDIHIEPQLIRDRERYVGREHAPFGGDFLDQMARMQQEQKRTFNARMRRIIEASRIAVPQLEKLELVADERGVPHLRGLYEQDRPDAGWQNEDQFSDGTLRLLGLLWALLDGVGPLLVEEPERSLHSTVIGYIPAMMWRLGRKTGRQILVSTHSADLLSDESIAAEEVLMLEPAKGGTRVSLAATHEQIRALLAGGLSIGQAVIPRTAPPRVEQLSLISDE